MTRKEERGIIGKSLESGLEVRDGVGGHLSSEVQYLYAPMGLWLLMMLVVLLMCMRLGDLRPIIASFDGRRPCYRNGLCWREYMYLGRKPYRMLHLVNIWTALICSQAQDCDLCKAQSSPHLL